MSLQTQSTKGFKQNIADLFLNESQTNGVVKVHNKMMHTCRAQGALEKIFHILNENSKSKENFFICLQKYLSPFSDEFCMVEKAYSDAERFYEDKLGSTLEDYLEHIRGVAIIILRYLKVLQRRDISIDGHKILTAAVLHSITTNSGGKYGLQELEMHYGADVLRIVDSVTLWSQDSGDGAEYAAINRFHGRLQQDNVTIDVIMVLLADVVHNHIVEWPRFRGNTKEKISETWNFYRPLAISWGILVYELEAATILLSNNFTK